MTIPAEEMKRRRERVQHIEFDTLENIRKRANGEGPIELSEVLDLLDYIAHLESVRWGLRSRAAEGVD